jgi:hypothetical protein
MRRGVRSLASADSSFIASFSASCTNSLIAGSPQAPSEPRPKPPAKPLAPAMPTPSISQASPSSTRTPMCFSAFGHDLRRAGLVVVVAEHRDDGAPSPRRQFVGQHVRFFGRAVVGEVAAQQQRVGGLEAWRRRSAGCRRSPW